MAGTTKRAAALRIASGFFMSFERANGGPIWRPDAGTEARWRVEPNERGRLGQMAHQGPAHAFHPTRDSYIFRG
jgi:hypothetical protein